MTKKPYDFVGFKDEPPRRASGTGHDSLHKNFQDLLTGTIQITLRTLTPLHVGSGYSDFLRARGREQLVALMTSILVRDGENIKRVFIIPGSSLKGAVRGVVETITQSCVRVAKRKTRDHLQKSYYGCSSAKELCFSCRTFGSPNYQGHVSFMDVVVGNRDLGIIDAPLLHEPGGKQDLPPFYLGEDGMLLGRKFYFHASPAEGEDLRLCVKDGIQLKAQVNFMNLSTKELGILFIAFGLHPNYRFPIKVGGGKPVGFGSVSIEVDNLNLMRGQETVGSTGRLGTSQLLQGNELTTYIQEAIDQSESLYDTVALEQVASIYSRAGLRLQAPSDPY